MSRASIALACALVGVSSAAALATPYERSERPAPASAQQAERADYEVQAARRATRRFRSLRVAKQAGYERAGACVEGMGFHYANPELIGDGRLQIRRPEILVYQQRGGRMRLVALEYFRPDADQRLDTDDDRPRLFERPFDGPMEGHEPGMPIHYDLHAWLYKRNPDGRFTALNPRVSC
jgi:hypothetical protein